LVVKGEIYK